MTTPFDAFSLPMPADTAQVNELIATAAAALPPLSTLDPVMVRTLSDEQARSSRPRCDWAEERVIETGAGPAHVRVFVPPTVKSVYLYIHGGAWFMGARDLADGIMAARAEQADTAVVSLEYRLAPEHPWPAPGDDCEQAALWLAANSVEEFGTDRLLIGGDSAGAHLAAVTLLRLRDRHGHTPFCGADFRYGMFDLRQTPSLRQSDGGMLDAKSVSWMLDLCYTPEQRETADASPLLADLHDLPPALFTCGTGDTLVDDTLFMYARWVAAGNRAELSLHPGDLHAFDYAPVASAADALSASVAFIKSVQ